MSIAIDAAIAIDVRRRCRFAAGWFDVFTEGGQNMATIGRNSSKANRDFGSVALWVGQGLLAALFLFAGGFKLVASAEMMSQGPVVLPLMFLRFIGLCEVLGAIGLILPWALKIHRELTPLAA